MVKPNCLIVGAAKSGTSALYKYLSKHPDVFCPAVKEPKYLTSVMYLPMTNGPGDGHNLVNNIFEEDDYLKLYEEGKDKKIRIDASADLLYYHEVAITNIKRLLGEPYIIICLRNPVERAFSAYLHLVRDKRETYSFDEALKSEQERIENRYEFIWHYKKASLYYEAVKAYAENFAHVKIVFQEVLDQNTDALLAELTAFLNIAAVPIGEIQAFERVNVSKVVKHRWLEKILFYKYKLPFYQSFLNFFGPWKSQIKVYLDKARQSNLHRPEIRQSTKRDLIKDFLQDIENLENYLGINLSHWK